MKGLRWMLLLLFFAGAWGVCASAQDAKPTLTNQDVVSLVKTGLSPDIIVAKIHSSNCQFDTSSAGLKALKDAGVPDPVIVAMIDPTAKPSAPAGASSGGPEGTGPAIVRVYRPKLLPGNNFSPPIYVDGTEVFTLSNAKRCSVHVGPGSHTITSDDKSSRIEIDAKPGQEYYISVQELPGGFLKGRGKLTLVAPEQGRPEYKVEKPLEDERKVAKDMIEPDSDADSQPAAK